MAFSPVGSFGTASSGSANQTSLALTTTATLSVGNFAVLVCASDNTRTTDGDDSFISGITDSAGNTWTKALGFANGQGAAKSGASCELWYSKITSQLNSGSTVTISYNNTADRDATAATGYNFTVAGTVSIEATNTLATDNVGNPGSLDATTSSIACLRVRGFAYEHKSATILTATSGWTGFDIAIADTGGSSLTCMEALAEFIISTATGSASNPTLNAGSGNDSASCYVAFKETALPGGGPGGSFLPFF